MSGHFVRSFALSYSLSEYQRLEMHSFIPWCYPFEGDQLKTLCDSLFEVFVRIQGKKSFGVVGVIFPDSFEIVATVHSEKEQSIWLQNFPDIL